MAHYCITVLEHMARGRNAAALHFGIGFKVLNRIGMLCNENGGEDARKSKGAATTFTPVESEFLCRVVPDIIFRVAQVTAVPDQVEPKIELDKYFPLSKAER